MKRLVAFIVLLIAGGGGAYYYYVYGKPVEKPTVMQAAISQGDIVEAVQASGTLDPVRRVDVGSQVSGQVQELYVDFNSNVTQGMLLAKIDPTLLETQVQIQKANIARQEGDIDNQMVQLEDVKKQLERTRAMFEKGLQNQQQLEQAELAVKMRQAQIDSAKKQLVQAQANLAQAELNVSYTEIRSPIDGVVVDRRVDRGQTVQASMTSPQFFILATDLHTLKLLSQDVYEVTLSYEQLPDGVVADLEARSPLRLSVSGHTIEVALRESEEQVLALVSDLRRRGRILRVEVGGASLEDIFVELMQETGA